MSLVLGDLLLQFKDLIAYAQRIHIGTVNSIANGRFKIFKANKVVRLLAPLVERVCHMVAQCIEFLFILRDTA